MTKYDEQFRLSVVQSYEQGTQGFKAVARRYGLDHGLVRRWVKAYQEHGLAGLRKKYSHYSAAFKLSVLQRMQQEGLSARQAIALFNLGVSATVITDWERRYHEQGLAGLQPKPRGRPKKMPVPESPKPVEALPDDARSREDLMEEVKYLRAEVAYLKKLRALRQAKEQAAQRKRG